MKRTRIFAILFSLALCLVTVGCTIADSHVHNFVNGQCECGKIEKVAVLVDADNGEDIKTVYVNYTKTLKALETPSKKGYTFSGWYLEDELYDFESKVTTSITLKAKWDINTYQVTYDFGDGPKVEGNPTEFNVTDNIVLLKPLKENYDFLGWFEKTSGLKYDEINGVAQNLELVAKYKPTDFEIKYHLDEGTNNKNNPLTYTVEESYKLFEPEKSGYIFLKWVDKDGNEVKEIKLGTSGTLELFAKWEEAPYKIKYELNGGTNNVDNPVGYSIEKVQAGITLKDPERLGYDFLGWTLDANSTNYFTTLPTNLLKDITIYAHWTPTIYKLTYVNEGNAVENKASYTIETETFTLAKPSREGYVFSGWYVGNEKKEQIEKGTTGNITLTAKWDAIDYTINYVLNGGTNSSLNPSTYTIEDSITLQNPTREHYEFVEWKEGSTINKGQIGEKTFTAVWTPKDYSISYELNGGTIYATTLEEFSNYFWEAYETWYGQSVDRDAALAEWNSQKQETYKLFVKRGKEQENAEYFFNDPNVDQAWHNWFDTFDDIATVWNYWGGPKQMYNLLINNLLISDAKKQEIYNAFIIKAIVLYNIETETFTLAKLSRDGYEFKGWYVGNEKKEQIEKGTTGNITLTAKWEVINYTINYVLNGGTNDSSNPSTYTVDDYISLVNPTREHYVFVEWEEGSTINKGQTGEKTFTAVWKPQEYSIFYELNGGTVSKVPTTLKEFSDYFWEAYEAWYGQSVDRDAALAEWNSHGQETYKLFVTGGKGQENAEYFFNDPSVDEAWRNWFDYLDSVIGLWSSAWVNLPKIYNLLNGTLDFSSYNVTAKEIYAAYEGQIDHSYNIETKTFALQEPKKAGYTFLGWYNEDTKVEEIEKGSTGNITLVAKWIAISYNITYDLAGGSLKADESNLYEYTIETSTFTLFEPTRDGYTFAGWYNGEDKVTTVAGGTIDSLNLVAKWEVIEYTINFDFKNANLNVIDESKKLDEFSLNRFNTRQINGYEASLYSTPNTTIYWYHIVLKKTANENFYKIIEIAASSVSSTDYDLIILWHNSLTDATAKTVLTKIYNNAKNYVGDYMLITNIPAESSSSNANINVKVFDAKDCEYKDSVTSTYTIESNKINLPTPSKEYYHFSGWYIEDTKVEEIKQGSFGNLTLTAKWEAAKYSISYEIDGGKNAESNLTEYTIENDDIVLAAPTKDHYDFKGWYTTEDFQEGTKLESIIKGTTGNITLYAKWEPKEYSISYVLNEGTLADEILNPTKYTIETETFNLPTPTRKNYSFEGWYTTNDFQEGTKLESITKGTTENITLYAKWEVAPYSVKFNTNGGNTIADINFSVNSGLPTSLPIPTKLGYTFDGWYDNESLDGDAITEITEYKTYNLYAKWSLVTYTITYELNGGTNNSSNPVSYTIEESVTLSDPSRNGYTFKGWEEGSTITKGTTEDKTFTAKWEVIEYTITYNLDGGNFPFIYSSLSSIKSDFDQDYKTNTKQTNYDKWKTNISLTYVFTQTNHKWDWLLDYWADVNTNSFDGVTNASVFKKLKENGTIDNIYYLSVEIPSWYLSQQQSVSSGALKSADYTSDIVNNKIWSFVPLNAKYSYNITTDYSLTSPTKDGYIFLGWYDNKDFNGDTISSITTGTTGNITLYAKWEKSATITYILDENTYLINYNSREELINELISDIKSVKGSSYDLAYFNTHTSSGYNIFAGTSDAPTFFANDAMRTKWTWLLEYMKETRTASGLDVSQYDGLIQNGYVTAGLTVNIEMIGFICGKEYTYSSSSSSNYGKISIAYGYQNNKYLQNNTFAVDSKLNDILPEAFKEGYSFLGWYTSSDFSESSKVTSNTILSSDISLYPKFYRVLTVGPNEEYKTLDEAIAAATDNCKIVLAAGEYTLSTVINKDIIIEGPNANLSVSEQGTSEALINVTKDTVKLASKNIVFNGVHLKGSGVTGSGGVYFEDGGNAENVTFKSCVISNMKTFVKFALASSTSNLALAIEDCHIHTIGQFIVWTATSGVNSIVLTGSTVDGGTCGAVGNNNAALFRVKYGSFEAYNNIFNGTSQQDPGYFEAISKDSYIKYNVFNNVSKYVFTSAQNKLVFDNNLYIDSEGNVLESVPSEVKGTGVTADATVAKSEAERISYYNEYLNQ